MYEKTPNKNLIYSPLPTRYYIRTNGARHTLPGYTILRSRDQAWWNLVWLISPKVDVLKITTEEELTAYADNNHRELHRIASLARSLIKKSDLCIDIPLDIALKTMNPTVFVDYLQELPYKKTKLFQGYGEELIETMRARAVLSEQGKLILMNKSASVLTADKANFKKIVAPSEISRCAWLHQAALYFEPVIEEAGLTLPPIELVLDDSLTARRGVCYGPKDDGVRRIGISPFYIDSTELLVTLAHELVHAVDDGENGHYKPFIHLANRLGFTGEKLPIRPGPTLLGRLNNIRAALGPYPHFSAKFELAT